MKPNLGSHRFTTRLGHMLRGAIGIVLLTSVSVAQDQNPAPAADTGAATLTQRQVGVADRYGKLEELLLRLADMEADENPERAALLRRAARQSRDKFVLEKLRGATQSLQSEQYQNAIQSQGEATEGLESLLTLLLSEDRSKRIRDEKERVARMIQDLKRIERAQRSTRARTENNADIDEVEGEQNSIAERAEQLGKDLKDDEAESGEAESSEAGDEEGKPESDEAKSSESKPGEGKPSEGGQSKEGEPKPGEGKPDPGDKTEPDASGEDKPKSDDAGKPDPAMKPEEGADSQESEPKPGEPQAGEQAEGGKPSDSKPSDSKPSETKPGESKPSESQPGQPSQPGEQQSGEQQSGEQQSGESPQQPQQPQSPQQQAEQQLDQAIKKMREAEKRLEEAKRGEAVEQQRLAEENLRAAIDRLERILRQLREEEMQRELAKLESRLRKMAAMQSKVLDETVSLAATPKSQRNRQTDLKAGDLAFEEKKITLEADRAMLLLREEGSSVAFPEVVEQIRADTARVADRLAETNIDEITQGIQKDILAALEEMIAALQKAQRDLEQKKQQQQQQEGQPSQQGEGEQPLVEAIAELKLIRTMETRIKSTTERYAGLLEAGETTTEDVLPLLQTLAERQSRLYRITRDLVLKRNQ